MKKNEWLPIDSPWFINLVVPIAYGVLGIPVSIYWLTQANGELFMLVLGASFTPYCALTGFLIFRLITLLGPSTKEENV